MMMGDDKKVQKLNPVTKFRLTVKSNGINMDENWARPELRVTKTMSSSG